jgi:prepilin-type N-terminal cleavage/methylation domain-containing protein/prepilin-type processing-associated H-X9-DG protein
MSRRGFSVIELLVAISVIAVLIALLVPAVQKVRDAAARTECGNNLHQIGLAVHHYHEEKKVFPAGLREFSDPFSLSSWLTHILPYLEQQELWAVTQVAYKQSPSPFNNPPHVGFATVIPAYVCPAEPRAAQVQIDQVTGQQVSFTCYLGVSGKNLNTRDGVFYRDSKIRTADITDGSSNTLLAGERPPSTNFNYGYWYAGAGQNLTGSGDMILGVQEQNVLTVTTGSCPPGTYSFAPGSVTNQCDFFHFWSLHIGGAHFLFADGSVRFLSYSAAPILPALASRAGGEIVTDAW